MKTNADRFPTAIARLTYVAGRLTGKAYELILPKIRYGVPDFLDYPEMLAYLEDALSSLLFQGISRELQDMLLYNPTPSRKYRKYANHLQMLDNRYRQYQQQISRNRTPAPVRTPTSYAAAAALRASAAASPGQPRRISSPRPEWRNIRPASPSAAGGDPMDLSAQKRFVPGGRKERGECFRCGLKNHRVAACPKPDIRSSSQLHQFRARFVHRPSNPSSTRSISPPSSPPNPTKGVNLG
jgi:hypothetical protein